MKNARFQSLVWIMAMPFGQLFDLNPNKAHKVIVGTVKDGIK